MIQPVKSAAIDSSAENHLNVNSESKIRAISDYRSLNGLPENKMKVSKKNKNVAENRKRNNGSVLKNNRKSLTREKEYRDSYFKRDDSNESKYKKNSTSDNEHKSNNAKNSANSEVPRNERDTEKSLSEKSRHSPKNYTSNKGSNQRWNTTTSGGLNHTPTSSPNLNQEEKALTGDNFNPDGDQTNTEKQDNTSESTPIATSMTTPGNINRNIPDNISSRSGLNLEDLSSANNGNENGMSSMPADSSNQSNVPESGTPKEMTPENNSDSISSKNSASPNLCKFPWSDNNSENIYVITPSAMNAGWAMSPDQECTRGSWCPYACKPGYYSSQWDPTALEPNGPGSMNGGLYCDNNGILQKPFPDKAYCLQGVGNAIIRNKLSQPVSACQTVYPGNEAMIIPSVAQPGSTVPLNVVPSTFWAGTSSQFYVNLAGSTEAQCIWGNPDKPVGNWGPYIFGAGQAKDGNTYISVQYNPLYSEVGFKTTDTYNVEIKCVSGKCNFPESNECKCEKGTCSVKDGCTVTLMGDAKAEFVLY
ncbi:putative secreted beta-glucosidase adg3 [Smittium mucronatum]|uniref:Putative secreted beta-glucosidase adg3 n=1 Tax=Smittium mucronatum TaxID=133383 RepID=A0A1R0GU70_9FUNG|nr:putative secreted beta-glucosidase adg3 [Smittium mucronatum]